MRLLKVFGVVLLLFAAFAVFAALSSDTHSANGTDSSFSNVVNSVVSAPGDPYDRSSTERLDAWELLQNPYKLKGHSGILTNVLVHTAQNNFGSARALILPGGPLRFRKMLEEHTASYNVMTVGYELEDAGELIVYLADNDQPDPHRPWRVLVMPPFEGTNVFGAGIKTAAVRFEGYYDPPSIQAPQPTAPTINTNTQSAPTEDSPAEAPAADVPVEQKQQEPPTPIERVPVSPPTDQFQPSMNGSRKVVDCVTARNSGRGSKSCSLSCARRARAVLRMPCVDEQASRILGT